MAFIPHDHPLPDRYTGILITKLETMCCMSRRHALANQDHVPIDALLEQPLVLFKNSFFQTERIIARFEAAGITPKILLQSDQLSTIHKLIASNAAVGFLFRQVIDTLPEIAFRPLDPPMTTQVSLVWHTTSCLSAEQRRFIEYIRSLML